jgi:hypothetical protein
VTVRVETTPDAVVAYVAAYSDGRSGAPAPWGAGYGGNAGGHADARGVYTNSWTVKPSTPAGPATVDVVVGKDGMSNKTTVAFAVAKVSGECDG